MSIWYRPLFNCMRLPCARTSTRTDCHDNIASH